MQIKNSLPKIGIVMLIVLLLFIFGKIFYSSKGQTSRQISESVLNGPVILAAGDIADCNSKDAEATGTARLLDSLPGTILALGDTAYPDGTKKDFDNCYGTTWGRHKYRTRPAVGNHEYHTKDAVPYFDYFGKAAGEKGKGYYSFRLGEWKVIAINSELCDLGQCLNDSPQVKWLKNELSSNEKCTLAYMHHPRFGSGSNGSNVLMQPIWQVLYDAGVDVVLAGHDHDYERFAPQDSQGNADTEKGIRQFIVGTGGGKLGDFSKIVQNSEVQNSLAHGVLKITLGSGEYEWQFISLNNNFTDKGRGSCH